MARYTPSSTYSIVIGTRYSAIGFCYQVYHPASIVSTNLERVEVDARIESGRDRAVSHRKERRASLLYGISAPREEEPARSLAPTSRLPSDEEEAVMRLVSAAQEAMSSEALWSLVCASCPQRQPNQWSVTGDQWRVTNGEWQVAGDQRQAASDQWALGSDQGSVTNGEWSGASDQQWAVARGQGREAALEVRGGYSYSRSSSLASRA